MHVPLYEPNDDTTSDDPDEDDDDETSKSLHDPDDTDAPIVAWLEESAPCPVPPQRALVSKSAPPSSSLLTLKHLRC
jgi:hypothetical protein